jgi:hypothetical protein
MDIGVPTVVANIHQAKKGRGKEKERKTRFQ